MNQESSSSRHNLGKRNNEVSNGASIAHETGIIDPIDATKRKILNDNLSALESVHVLVEGTTNQYLIATNNRLIIVNMEQGLDGIEPHPKVRTLSYAKVNSIQCIDGSYIGKLRAQVSRIADGKTTLEEQDIFNFNTSKYHEFQCIQRKIEGLIQVYRTIAAETSQVELVAQHLKKLKDLKDQGVFTRQEFESKKLELMSRI
ncbi:SHOCT domain-containing protein [Chloroflexota bacterium]